MSFERTYSGCRVRRRAWSRFAGSVCGTRPGCGPGAGHRALTPEESQDITRIEEAVGKADTTTLDEYGGLYKAMEYRKMLLDRPSADAKTPRNRIRIDRGQALVSDRFPRPQEDLR